MNRRMWSHTSRGPTLPLEQAGQPAASRSGPLSRKAGHARLATLTAPHVLAKQEKHFNLLRRRQVLRQAQSANLSVFLLANVCRLQLLNAARLACALCRVPSRVDSQAVGSRVRADAVTLAAAALLASLFQW
eukprot:363759-Chlamydomonas_euryale.AAC.16